MPEDNIIMLQTVAKGLEELKDEVVFAGGAVAQMYVDDPTLTDIRPTKDVDCIIEISSRLNYDKLGERLRKKGFSDEIFDGVIFRWMYKGIKVDIMLTDETILGFSNIWYVEGIRNKIVKTLPNGEKIFIFSPEYFLAAKFEALKNRGSADLRQSHDFEDIIYILDNNPQMPHIIKNAGTEVKNYLVQKLMEILSNPNIKEAIETALPFGSGDERITIIIELISEIIEVDK